MSTHERASFERWMLEEAKCVVGSSDPYPAGLERMYWQCWQAARRDLETPASTRGALEELVCTATEVHRISNRAHEAWIALAAALDEARTVMASPVEHGEKP